MSDFERWAGESEIAKKIDVPTRVILFDTAVRASDLRNGAAQSISIPKKVMKQKAPFALEAGGKIIARGRIVERFGEKYFKVSEIEEE